MVPKTWRWYATSPSIWSAKSPTSDQSSAAASAPPGTLNTCWTFSAPCSQSRVNLDSLPCVTSGLGVVGPAVEPGDFAASEAAGKAEQQDGAVAQAAQIVVEGRGHAQEIFGENGLLLVGRAGVAAADPAHHFGDV